MNRLGRILIRSFLSNGRLSGWPVSAGVTTQVLTLPLPFPLSQEVHTSSVVPTSVKHLNLKEVRPDTYMSASDPQTRDIMVKGMLVYEDFITEEEEMSLFEEVEPYLKRMRYEFDHWDNVSAHFS